MALTSCSEYNAFLHLQLSFASKMSFRIALSCMQRDNTSRLHRAISAVQPGQTFEFGNAKESFAAESGVSKRRTQPRSSIPSRTVRALGVSKRSAKREELPVGPVQLFTSNANMMRTRVTCRRRSAKREPSTVVAYSTLSDKKQKNPAVFCYQEYCDSLCRADKMHAPSSGKCWQNDRTMSNAATQLVSDNVTESKQGMRQYQRRDSRTAPPEGLSVLLS